MHLYIVSCVHIRTYVITEIEHGNMVKKYEVKISMH